MPQRFYFICTHTITYHDFFKNYRKETHFETLRYFLIKANFKQISNKKEIIIASYFKAKNAKCSAMMNSEILRSI